MKLEDLEIYRLAMKLGEKIWQIVAEWDYFQKDTVGEAKLHAGGINNAPQALMTAI